MLVGVNMVFAQQRKCGYTSYYLNLIEKYPEILKEEQELQQISEKSNYKLSQNSGIIQIPVVVHVLYNTENQNISDEQIKSQIVALNRDYRATNSDKLPGGHYFFDRIGDTEIEFCLAKENPFGEPTTGIERKYTSKISFAYSGNLNDEDENIIKKSINGGLDAWNPSKYLNIWIANFTDGTLGYATFPNDNAGIKDGVVIHYRAFGTTGNLLSSYNKGRTTTHEIGHWLGLKHIWGDVDNCFADDGISDTPKQYDATYGCPSGLYADECSPESTGRMYQNFMDYTDDACMALFTIKQADYMRNILNTKRSSFVGNDIPCEIISAVTNNTQIRNVKIYPNPASNYLFIDGMSNNKEPYQIRLFNELGQIVYHTSVVLYKTEIELSALRNGIYYLDITSGDKQYNQSILVLH